jgi:hypothetical protein
MYVKHSSNVYVFMMIILAPSDSIHLKKHTSNFLSRMTSLSRIPLSVPDLTPCSLCSKFGFLTDNSYGDRLLAKKSGKGGKKSGKGGKKGGYGDDDDDDDDDDESDCCRCKCYGGECECTCACDVGNGGKKSGKKGGTGGKKGDDRDDDDDDKDDVDDKDDDDDKGDDNGYGKGFAEDDGGDDDYTFTLAPTPSPEKDPYRVVTCGDGVGDWVAVEVHYAYSVQMSGSVDAGIIIEMVEAALLTAVTDELLDCGDNRRRRLNEVLGVSAAPKDEEVASCGDNCSDVAGGMTVYVSDTRGSDYTALQCRVFDIILGAVAIIQAQSNDIEEISVSDNGGVDCDSIGDDSGPDFSGSQNQVNSAGGFPMAVIAGILGFFVLLALLLFCMFRRCCRRDEGKDTDSMTRASHDNLMGATELDPSGSAAFGAAGGAVALAYANGKGNGPSKEAYENGYQVGFNAAGGEGHSVEPKITRAEVAKKAISDGYHDENLIDCFCAGYHFGYLAGAASRGYQDGHRGGHKEGRLKYPFIISRARNLGYSDMDAIDAYCSGYRGGDRACKVNGRTNATDTNLTADSHVFVASDEENAQGSSEGKFACRSDVASAAAAYGRGYHDGFVIGHDKPGQKLSDRGAMEKKARVLGLSDEDDINAYCEGLCSGLIAGNAKHRAAIVSGIFERAYKEGYETENASVSYVDLEKRARARGYSEDFLIDAYCSGRRAGILASKLNSHADDISLGNAAEKAGNAYGKGFKDGYIAQALNEPRANVGDLVDRAHSLGYIQKESVDAYLAGYRSGCNCRDSDPRGLFGWGKSKRGVNDAYRRGYHDGYEAGVESSKSGVSCFDVAIDPKDLEARARDLGYNKEAEVDAYCSGYCDGFLAGQAGGGPSAFSPIDVRYCASTSCEACRSRKEVVFLPINRDSYNASMLPREPRAQTSDIADEDSSKGI